MNGGENGEEVERKGGATSVFHGRCGGWRANKANRVAPFDSVPEPILRKIFTYLHLEKRIQLARTCKRFMSAAHDTCIRFPYDDDETPSWPCSLPKLLRSCPKMSAVQLNYLPEFFPTESGQALPVFASLRSLQLSDVDLEPDAYVSVAYWSYEVSDRQLREDRDSQRRAHERALTRYFEQFPNLEELWWHNLALMQDTSAALLVDAPVNLTLPESIAGGALRRLALANEQRHRVDFAEHEFAVPLRAAVQRMPQLERLYLGRATACFDHTLCATRDDYWTTLADGLASLTNLRELCLAGLVEPRLADLRNLGRSDLFKAQLLDPLWTWSNDFLDEGDGGQNFQRFLRSVVEGLPKLEVLVVASAELLSPELVAYLVTAETTTLRILVIAGSNEKMSKKWSEKDFVPTIIPSRQVVRSDPRNSNAAPPPPLQIFVGGEITRAVRFAKPQAAAAKFWLIDSELPDFLAKLEVAAIFQDVWVAKVIPEFSALESRDDGGPWREKAICSSTPLLFCGGH